VVVGRRATVRTNDAVAAMLQEFADLLAISGSALFKIVPILEKGRPAQSARE
jgi:hypothetical protein